MAHRFDVVTGGNCDRPVWECQSFVLGSEGCLLDVFSEETKYAVDGSTRQTLSDTKWSCLLSVTFIVRSSSRGSILRGRETPGHDAQQQASPVH
jgi:hypothetical protein